MGGRILQRHVLYLGELNGCQEASWRRSVELFSHEQSASQQVSLFPEDHLPQSQDSPSPTDTDPVKMWEYYHQLTEIEQALKNSKATSSFTRSITS